MKILDIGANRGLFTDKCIENFNNLKVVMVEANPQLYEYLKSKYINNNNITILNNLVSSEDETLKDFYLSNADTISTASIDWINNSRFSKTHEWYQPIKIKSITLDKLIEIHKDFNLIKIDVEGYELEVIKGLTKKHCEICFEWAEEEKYKINKTCEYLQNIGYKEFGYILGDEYLKKPDYFTSWENSSFNHEIDLHRKEKWGMMWVK